MSKISPIKKLFYKIFGIFYFILGKNVGPHRKSQRIRTSIVVRVAKFTEKFNSAAYASAVLLNISTIGICIEAQKEFAIGDILAINISFPSGQQYALSGNVVWVKDHVYTFLIGIHTAKANEKDLIHLLKYFGSP